MPNSVSKPLSVILWLAASSGIVVVLPLALVFLKIAVGLAIYFIPWAGLIWSSPRLWEAWIHERRASALLTAVFLVSVAVLLNRYIVQ